MKLGNKTSFLPASMIDNGRIIQSTKTGQSGRLLAEGKIETLKDAFRDPHVHPADDFTENFQVFDFVSVDPGGPEIAVGGAQFDFAVLVENDSLD